MAWGLDLGDGKPGTGPFNLIVGVHPGPAVMVAEACSRFTDAATAVSRILREIRYDIVLQRSISVVWLPHDGDRDAAAA
jgi:hypothetical protein